MANPEMFRHFLFFSTVLGTLFTVILCDEFPLALDLHPFDGDHSGGLHGRGDFVSFIPTRKSLTNYYVNISIGTPPQSFRVIVDTYEEATVVPAIIHPRCQENRCNDTGTYDVKASSSYQGTGLAFNFPLAAGVNGSRDIGVETIKVGGQDVTNTFFFVTYNGTDTAARLGLGYRFNSEYSTRTWNSLPNRLKFQGLSNISGYSLFFNRGTATPGGRLIFGGVDTNKFYNTLDSIRMDFPTGASDAPAPQIRMAEMTIFDGSKNRTITNSSSWMITNSSSPNFSVSANTLGQIVSLLNATWDSGSSSYLISPKATSNATTFNVRFGSTWINIPISDLWYPINATHNALAINDANHPYTQIGLPFFQNAYTVFDYTNRQISIAPLRHEVTSDNITAISLSGVTGLAGYMPNQTVGANSSASSTPTGNSPGDNPKLSGLSAKAKVGIGVGIGLGFLLILGATILLLRRYQRRRKMVDGEIHERQALFGFKHELPVGQGRARNVMISEVSGDNVRNELASSSTPIDENRGYALGAGDRKIKRKPVPLELPS